MGIKNWIKTHKLAFIGIAVGIVIVVLLIYSLISSTITKEISRPRKLYAPEHAAEEAIGFGFSKLSPSSVAPLPTPSSSPLSRENKGEIEIKEGSLEIESKEAESDSEKIKSITENYEGYVERSSKSITNLRIRINLTLRVPSLKFMDLLEKLKKEFEVKSYNIRNYRISVEREMDEFQILKQSLSDYEDIREEIQDMEVGKDKIELLMQTTNKELELKSRERAYEREISRQKRRGEYATLNVSIEQRKTPEIWPEYVFARFKDRIRIALDHTVEILKDLIGGAIEIFFKALQIVVYIFIIGIIVTGTYRLTKGIFRKILKR